MRRHVAAAVLVVAACAGCGSGVQTFTTGQITWVTCGCVGPPAPDAAVTRAEAVAARSVVVGRLVGIGRPPVRTFVWLGVRGRPRVVELVYRLPRRSAVDAVVPFAELPPDAPASGDCRYPYAPGWERLRARGVTTVYVGVDVVTRRVADVETDARREVESSVRGRPFPQCEEKE